MLAIVYRAVNKANTITAALMGAQRPAGKACTEDARKEMSYQIVKRSEGNEQDKSERSTVERSSFYRIISGGFSKEVSCELSLE